MILYHVYRAFDICFTQTKGLLRLRENESREKKRKENLRENILTYHAWIDERRYGGRNIGN